MRQTVGSTWILQLMILFILLFVGFIILTLNYSKSVKLKNEMISIVEKYEGMNENSIKLVNNFLLSSGYSVTAGCPSGSGVYGARDLTIDSLEKTQDGVEYYYCLKKYDGANLTNYYQITVFYKFNLPVLGDVSKFAIRGTTANFHAVDDSSYGTSIGS